MCTLTCFSCQSSEEFLSMIDQHVLREVSHLLCTVSRITNQMKFTKLKQIWAHAAGFCTPYKFLLTTAPKFLSYEELLQVLKNF